MRRIEVVESNEGSDIKQKPEIATNKEASVKSVSSPVVSSPPSATIWPFESKSASTGGTRLKIEEIDSSTGVSSSISTDDTRVVEEDGEKTIEEVGGSRTRGLGRRVEEQLMASSSSSCPHGAEGERGTPALPLSFAQFTKDWRTLHTSSQRQEKKAFCYTQCCGSVTFCTDLRKFFCLLRLEGTFTSFF